MISNDFTPRPCAGDLRRTAYSRPCPLAAYRQPGLLEYSPRWAEGGCSAEFEVIPDRSERRWIFIIGDLIEESLSPGCDDVINGFL